MFDINDDVRGALAEARALGFLGPGPLDDHVASARRFAEAIVAVGASGPALDLGSGGGVPGLLLASWFAAWEWTLFDAQRRRTSFLAAAVARCHLSERVAVLRGRAEDIGHEGVHRGSYGTVTARSFGPPAATAEAAAPLLREGGWLLVAEPPQSMDRWPAGALAAVGLVPAGVDGGIARLRQERLCPATYPRPTQKQRSVPLF